MAKVFLSPYASGFTGRVQDGGCAKSYASLHAAMRRTEWPFDYGDDPSFFSRLRQGGCLTWGVCRPDVRSQVQPGDVVVFFAFSKVEGGVEYRLSAIATVERKIAQPDIFLRPEYRRYRRYLNLLVRPEDKNGRRWTHHEPGSPEREWHKTDWLARVAPFRRFDKDELKRQSASNTVAIGAPIGGRPFAFGQNYVIFSADPSLTVVLNEPTLVAFAEPPGAELWRRDRLSRAIFSRTVGEAQKCGVKRSLRLADKTQHPHCPPIRWKIESDALQRWREDFVSLLSREGLVKTE